MSTRTEIRRPDPALERARRRAPGGAQIPYTPDEAARLARKARRARMVSAVVLAVSLLSFLVSFAWLSLGAFDQAEAQAVRPPAGANTSGESSGPTLPTSPGGELGSQGVSSDSELWRRAREGETFTVSIPNEAGSAFLVQSEGDLWRNLRNGPYKTYGVYALGGVFAVLALFFLVRGRIRVEHGFAGVTIQRFTGLERFAHWLLATSFIILALSGLNIMYGRYVLMPVVGAEAFTALSIAGKWAHNNVAWAFMAALVLVFLLWVAHNIPSWTDVKWIAKGGGLFVKGVHPDSRKFNAGQKLIFWSTILGGASLGASGVALLFPFETAMMAKTFATANSVLGTGLPTALTPIQEMQLQTTWHGIVALVMIVIIVAHIYIGSVGMEGAFAAMGDGQVDVNWAREHHNLWVEEEEAKATSSLGVAPAR